MFKSAMLKSIVAAGIALPLAASLAIAQGRPSTTRMTCSAARNLVQSRGAIVLSTGRDTYDRFVRDRSFCEFDEALDPLWAPTTDVAQCPVGFRCRVPDYKWFDDW
jgi:hypothetical protein